MFNRWQVWKTGSQTIDIIWEICYAFRSLKSTITLCQLYLNRTVFVLAETWSFEISLLSTKRKYVSVNNIPKAFNHLRIVVSCNELYYVAQCCVNERKPVRIRLKWRWRSMVLLFVAWNYKEVERTFLKGQRIIRSFCLALASIIVNLWWISYAFQ